MQILTQKIEAKKISDMINKRLERVTYEYQLAKGENNKNKAEALAETKWQLAEFKMQFVDLLIKQLEDDPEKAITN